MKIVLHTGEELNARYHSHGKGVLMVNTTADHVRVLELGEIRSINGKTNFQLWLDRHGARATAVRKAKVYRESQRRRGIRD